MAKTSCNVDGFEIIEFKFRASIPKLPNRELANNDLQSTLSDF